MLRVVYYLFTTGNEKKSRKVCKCLLQIDIHTRKVNHNLIYKYLAMLNICEGSL